MIVTLIGKSMAVASYSGSVTLNVSDFSVVATLAPDDVAWNHANVETGPPAIGVGTSATCGRYQST